MDLETYSGKYAEAIRRYIEDESSRPSELARELGVNEQSFHAIRQRLGVPAKNGKHGDRHWNWKGGRSTRSCGYTKIAVGDEHILASEKDRDGYVWEHRSVMSEHLGRALKQFETVHHRNGKHGDNRLENLQLRVGAHGPGIVLRCASCGSNDLEAMDV